MDFKPNLTLQNQLSKVRFAPIYKLLKGLISSRCGISNTTPHAETAQLVRETILFKDGPIVAQ